MPWKARFPKVNQAELKAVFEEFSWAQLERVPNHDDVYMLLFSKDSTVVDKTDLKAEDYLWKIPWEASLRSCCGHVVDDPVARNCATISRIESWPSSHRRSTSFLEFQPVSGYVRCRPQPLRSYL